MVTTQAAVPVQAPLQPPNFDPGSGVAVRVTPVPTGKLFEQLEPQSIPAGAEVTLPEPEPVRLTLSVC